MLLAVGSVAFLLAITSVDPTLAGTDVWGKITSSLVDHPILQGFLTLLLLVGSFLRTTPHALKLAMRVAVALVLAYQLGIFVLFLLGLLLVFPYFCC